MNYKSSCRERSSAINSPGVGLFHLNRVSTYYFVAALFFITIAQSACSYRFYYVIANSSSDALTVEYQFKKSLYAEEAKKHGFAHAEYYFEAPRLKNLDDWPLLPESQITRNATKGEVTIILQPGEVLQMYIDNGHALFDLDGAKDFPIAEVTLKGNKGRILFEGDIVLQQFRKSESESRTYEIRYP